MNGLKWFVTAITLVILVTVVVSFWHLQSEINSLRTEQENSPTNTTPAPQPNSIVEHKPPNDYVVYEWNLKPEYIDNVTWLNETLSEKSGVLYDSEKTWTENYIICVNSFYAFPQQLMNSHLEGLVGASFIRPVFGNTSFNEATGFTKATYQYAEYDGVPMYYGIESILPIIADSRGWAKNFI